MAYGFNEDRSRHGISEPVVLDGTVTLETMLNDPTMKGGGFLVSTTQLQELGIEDVGDWCVISAAMKVSGIWLNSHESLIYDLGKEEYVWKPNVQVKVQLNTGNQRIIVDCVTAYNGLLEADVRVVVAKVA